jgi:hypothetical protein
MTRVRFPARARSISLLRGPRSTPGLYRVGTERFCREDKGAGLVIDQLPPHCVKNDRVITLFLPKSSRNFASVNKHLNKFAFNVHYILRLIIIIKSIKVR